MFTGIVEHVGEVLEVTPQEGARRLRVAAPFAGALQVDQSVAVNGVCLTVVACDAEAFEAVAVEETLRKTALGSLAPGDGVNLERALRLGERLDGHLVQGHVDATGTVAAAEAEGEGRLVEIRFDPAFAAYLIPAGSVAVDGISLTVARLADEAFTVAIIPYTYAHTTAQHWRAGRRVNLEFDLLGKYVARWMAAARAR